MTGAAHTSPPAPPGPKQTNHHQHTQQTGMFKNILYTQTHKGLLSPRPPPPPRSFRPDLTAEEREKALQDLMREIAALWQTDELRRQRPSPIDGETHTHSLTLSLPLSLSHTHSHIQTHALPSLSF